MNFQRIKSTFRKERILLFRDMGGIAMLLVMPLLLILTMAIVQDAPFRDYQDIHLKMIWADEDGKPLGDSLKTMFRKSGRFDLLDSLQGRPITGDEARNLIGSGTYPIGVIVPKGSNAEMLNKTNKIINKIGKASGNPSIIPVRSDNDSAAVVLLFDPAAKATLKMAVQNSLEKMLFKVQLDLLFKKIGLDGDSTNQDVETESGQLLANQVRIESAYSGQSNGIAITSTQHNVPAWIVFALFFLIIPIAGSYIKEKGEGSRIRISMTPGSYIDIILGKVFFYTLFALFQFIFLFFVSGWVLPLAGLPAMPVGPYFWLALIASGVIAFAAISWGLMTWWSCVTGNLQSPRGPELCTWFAHRRRKGLFDRRIERETRVHREESATPHHRHIVFPRSLNTIPSCAAHTTTKTTPAVCSSIPRRQVRR